MAAVALDIAYDKTVLSNSASIKIKQNIANPEVILSQRIYSDNGTAKIRILLMTNKGTVAPGGLKSFIVWNPASIASGQTVTTGTFMVTSAKFYNESGAEVTTLGPNNVVKTLLYQ